MLILLFTAWSVRAQIQPTRLKPYFDERNFAVCLGEAIARAYGPRALYDKIEAIQARRTSLSAPSRESCKAMVRDLCDQAGLAIPKQIKAWLTPVGCVADRQVSESLVHHSTALVDSKVTGERTPVPLLSLTGRWELEQDAAVNLNAVPDLNAAVDAYGKQHGGLQGLNEDASDCLISKSDPLVRWLLAQGFQTTTPARLFHAVKAYEDPFVALAVIAQVFDTERQLCRSRSKGCVLGNRMKPMFEAGRTKYRNPVGENYHFWAQLNAGLTENLPKEKLGNYLLEWVKDQDSGEYSANAIGLDAGAAAVRSAREIGSHIGPKPPAPACRTP